MAWDNDTRWKALDLFVKATAGALIAAAVALFGYWMQEEQRRAAEENAQLRALVEFSSTQKNLDVNVGMQLLSKFVDYYLRPPAETFEANRQTLLMLRLLSLNFQDVPINLKPLFEDLDKRLRDSGQASAPELRDQLVSIAKEVANRQAYRFSYVGGILAKPVRVQQGAEIKFTDQGLPLMLKVAKHRGRSCQRRAHGAGLGKSARVRTVHGVVFRPPHRRQHQARQDQPGRDPASGRGQGK